MLTTGVADLISELQAGGKTVYLVSGGFRQARLDWEVWERGVSERRRAAYGASHGMVVAHQSCL